MNIVICAGGLNTRFEELSKFPKVLLPIDGNESILMHDYALFKGNKIALVINEKYFEMAKEYCNLLELPIQVIKSTNANGSYNTLKSVESELYGYFGEKNPAILYIWSDLILDYEAKQSIFEAITKMVHKNIAFTYSLDYRLGAGGEHNLPGVYYCANKLSVPLDSKKDYDLAEYLTANPLEASPIIGRILEYRDLKTFEKIYKSGTDADNKMKTRFFNQLTITGDKLIKKCVNKNYDHLIEKEVAWYKECKSKILLDYDIETPLHTMTLKFIEGQPVKDVYAKKDFGTSLVALMYILRKLQLLHSSSVKQVKKETYLEDTYLEYVEKPLKRCREVAHIIDGYDDERVKALLEKAYKFIIGHRDTETYYLIHGDVNGSNVIMKEDFDDVVLIDPRGYFGKSSNYGPRDYDLAKVLYALLGYDELNNTRCIYYSKEKYDNDWLMDSPYNKLLKTLQHTELADPVPMLIVGGIFLSLTSYIGQDIMKANIAYQTGLLFLEDVLGQIQEAEEADKKKA